MDDTLKNVNKTLTSGKERAPVSYLRGYHVNLPLPARLILRNPLAVISLMMSLLLVLAALWPVAWLPHDPYVTQLRLRFLPPFWQTGAQAGYPLGTDALGRDILSMMIHGARYSLLLVSLAALLSLVLGVAAGLVSGLRSGWPDSIIMRLVDIQLAFPLMALVLAVVAVLGPSLPSLVMVLGFSGWAPYARIVRGQVLGLRKLEFVEAARCIGGGDLHIIVRHLIPNIVTPVVIFATFELARLLLLEAVLSYLGLGIQPPTPSWGSMIADGREHMFEAWWASALPGLAIVLTVTTFNLLGDGLRDALDPLTQK